MPGRVTEAGITDATLPVTAIADALRQRVSAGRGANAGSMEFAVNVLAGHREVMHGMY